MIGSVNLKKGRGRQPGYRAKDIHKLKVRDLVLLKNCMKCHPLNANIYIFNFRIFKVIDERAVDLQDPLSISG